MSLQKTPDINGLNNLSTQPYSARQGKSPLIQNTNRIVREAECKLISGLSRTSRWEKEQKGEFPKRIQISERAVGWRLFDLMDWLEGLSDAE